VFVFKKEKSKNKKGEKNNLDLLPGGALVDFEVHSIEADARARPLVLQGLPL